MLNRKLSYLAGMFLEDEREVTGIQEDVYYRKKPSLLLLDPKSQVSIYSRGIYCTFRLFIESEPICQYQSTTFEKYIFPQQNNRNGQYILLIRPEKNSYYIVFDSFQFQALCVRNKRSKCLGNLPPPFSVSVVFVY